MMNKIDLMRADLNLLVLFEIVHEERHVGRAAERLHLTPSAVSHGLGRLRKLFNDPLFIRTPKGVMPTARSIELATPVADILARARSVISTAAPFDPAKSTRRFTIGAPDGVSAVFLTPLLARLGKLAPGIDLSLRQLLPLAGESSPELAWRPVFANLEAGAIDIAVVPASSIPARFYTRCLYRENFVIAAQVGHPFVSEPTLARYCEMRHLMVSGAGDPWGFVDKVLASHGLSRRIALTVPDFMSALAITAETDLISALPKRLVAMNVERFRLAALEPPLQLETFQITAVAPSAAMMDEGLAWLSEQLAQTVSGFDV